MRAATRPGFIYRGRHHHPVLARFRPTWRQAVVGGLLSGCLASLLVALAGLSWRLLAGAGVPVPASTLAGGPGAPGRPGWLVLVALPAGLGLVLGTALRHAAQVRLDRAGISSRPGGDVSWQQVTDIRAERRHGRTVLSVYRGDGGTLRLAAPYDGWLLDGDPRFEQKLFVLRNVWDTHRRGHPNPSATGPVVDPSTGGSLSEPDVA